MGEHKKNSGVSFSRAANREWSDLRARQMVEADRTESKRERLTFKGVGEDQTLCEHDHGTLKDAWDCCGAVVVVDESKQVWSLYQAYKWGLIDLEPVQAYVASKIRDFDEDD